MTTRQRHRSIVFTLNNFTQDELLHIQSGPFKYLVFQQERGASGTPHLQGYAQMGKPIEFSTWKRLIGDRAYVANAVGTPQQNKAYCTKGDARIPGTEPYESGTIPEERGDPMAKLIEGTKDSSKTLADIFEASGPEFLRHYKGVIFARGLIAEPRREKTQVHWFFGGTGLGKSFLAHKLAPNGYGKNQSKWWDGYDPVEHDDVIIDEFRASFSPWYFLLQLFDENPLRVEFKGGIVNFRAKRIFITTPYAPHATWQDRTEEDVQQLLRRLTTIVEFLPGRIWRFHKGSPSDLPGSGITELAEPFSELPASQASEAEGSEGDDVRRVRSRCGSGSSAPVGGGLPSCVSHYTPS